MADKVKVFKVVGFPMIGDAEVTPEIEVALKHNNPDLYDELMAQKAEFYGKSDDEDVTPDAVVIIDGLPADHEDVVVNPPVLVVKAEDEKDLPEGTNVLNPAPDEAPKKKGNK